MRKKIILLLIFLCFILSLIGSSFFIFKTNAGKKMLNSFFPNMERTINLYHDLNPDIKSFKFDTKGLVNGDNYTIIGDNYIDHLVNGSVSTKLIMASSTVNKEVYSGNFYKALDSGLLIQDAYDGTYHSVEDDYFEKKTINHLLKISPQLVMEWLEKDELGEVFNDASKNIVIKREISAQAKNFYNIEFEQKKTKMEVVFNKDSYLIDKIIFEFNNSDYQISLETVFSGYNLVDVENNLEMPTVGQYGDYLARESFVIRTNDLSSKDYLWQRWEKDYYNCIDCVNKYGDSDKDGLSNLYEFLFNTDPFSTEKNDLEQIRESNHPITKSRIESPYIESTEKFISYERPGEKIGEAKIRHASFTLHDFELKGRDLMRFDFKFDEDPRIVKDYFTVHLGEELVFRRYSKLGDDLKTAVVSINKDNKDKATIDFTINSIGEPGKGIEVGNIQFAKKVD